MRDGLFKMRILGPPEFERCVIRDDREVGLDRFWTGRCWSTNLRKALLFFDPLEVAATVFRLTRRHFSRLYRERRYNLRMRVTVYGHDGATAEQVEEYLRKALTFKLDYVTHGPGPGGDTMVLVSIPSVKLREIISEK